MTKYLLLVICLADAFANVQAVGRVAEIRHLAVTPLAADRDPVPGGNAVPVAMIRIDNNMPDYELVLDFNDPGFGEAVSEIRLRPVGGILGEGGTPPDREVLRAGPVPGSFKWSPGTQASATIGYLVEVLVAWKSRPAAPATLTVSMPSYP